MADAGLRRALVAMELIFPMAFLQDYTPVVIAIILGIRGGASLGPGALLGAVDIRVNEGIILFLLLIFRRDLFG